MTGGSVRCPSAARSGAARVDSAIMAASGLPGRPMMNLPSGSSASTAGWPGRMAMPSISSRPPSSATERRRWSVPDRPVPPGGDDDVGGQSSAAGLPGLPRRQPGPKPRRVRCPRARRAIRRSCRRFSFRRRRSRRAFPPRRRVGAEGVAHLPRLRDPGRDHLGAGEAPAGPRALPRTGRVSWPARAARARWAGLSTVPRLISTSPAAASSAAFRMCSPFRGSPGLAAPPSLQDREPVLVGGNRRRFRSAARPSRRAGSARP